MKLYLGGPMTGIPLYNFPAFHEAADVLRKRGHEIVSPAEMDQGDGFDPETDAAESHLHYMRRDLAAVMECEGVVMLPGWRQSKGARCEFTVAETCGLALLEYDPTVDGGVRTVQADAAPVRETGEVRVVNETTGGMKGAKPERLGLLPFGALAVVARVYAHGADKYAPHNFRKGYAWSLSIDAMLRHLGAFIEGEDNDPESGLPHLAHATFHTLALLTFMAEHPELDDRVHRVLEQDH